MFFNNKFVRIGLSVLVGVTILVLWEVSHRLKLVSPLVLPAIAEVLENFKIGVIEGEWWYHIGVTASEGALGFFYGALAALVIGSLFAFVDTLRISFYPYILALQTFPKLAIAPILVTWLGYGMAPKVVIAAILAFFPIFVNTIAGLRSVSEGEIDLLRAMRATPLQEFRYLRLPRALAYIFPSLTVAVVVALLGAIVGEFVGSQAGLGYLILQLTFLGDTAAVYAVLMVLSLMGMTSYSVLVLLERMTKYK